MRESISVSLEANLIWQCGALNSRARPKPWCLWCLQVNGKKRRKETSESEESKASKKRKERTESPSAGSYTDSSSVFGIDNDENGNEGDIENNQVSNMGQPRQIYLVIYVFFYYKC